MTRRFIIPVAVAILCSGISLSAQEKTGREQIKFSAEPFDISQARLVGDSPFKHAEELDAAWLLSLKPDRFLAWFRRNSGLEPKAEQYQGWEGGGAAGHCFGHYLSACSRFWANTGDIRFKQIIDYCIDELELCQKARGTGYLGAMPEEDRIWAEVSTGDIRYVGGGLNGGWVPMYTLHKVHAGLIDAYRYGGNEKALELLSRLTDWEIKEFNHLTPEQFSVLILSEYGGLNDSLAESYALTGNATALELACKFHDGPILDSLAEGIDMLEGKHSNTQIPKAIGEARIYELDADPVKRSIAENFWKTMVNNRSYVNGGNSNHEHLGKPGHLNDELSASTTETCNTYNMLKLTRHLFEWSAGNGYMEYFERALYNHILASQHPETGMVSYFVPLKSATYKTFCQPDTDFFCCTGTGMENHSKYSESIYFKSSEDNGLIVSLFIDSELDWKEKGIKVRMKTAFPYDNRVDISFSGKASKFPIRIRAPKWAHSDIPVTVNGKSKSIKPDKDGYLVFKGKWGEGSHIRLELPMDIYTVAMPDNPNRVGVFYGPILLCANLGRELPMETEIPRFVNDGTELSSKFTPVLGKPLHFMVESTLDHPIEFMPFFEIHDLYHAVYHDIMSQEQWDIKLKAEIERIEAQKRLEARTVDMVYSGEQQSERDHSLVESNSGTGYAFGKHYRHGLDSSFSYTLSNNPGEKMELLVTLWGSDVGNRTFDVIVEGERVRTITLANNNPEKFYDEIIPLDGSLTKGKPSLVVTFQAHPGNVTGGIFGVRLAVCE